MFWGLKKRYALLMLILLLSLYGIRRWIAAHDFTPPPLSRPGTDPVVFIGDSIFYGWSDLCSHFNSCINAGVGGETSTQMQQRFARDVLAHHPRLVIIFAGINDLKIGHTGITEIQRMAHAARESASRVVLCTLIPADWSWDRSSVNASMGAIIRWNNALLVLATREGYEWADLYTPMIDPDGHQDARLFTSDHVHPNEYGYEILWQTLSHLEPHAHSGT